MIEILKVRPASNQSKSQ